MDDVYIGGRSPTVYAMIAVVFSFFVVLITSNYVSYIMPKYLPTIQRLSFIATAGFFMALFKYSVFENWKLDVLYLTPFVAIALYLPFLEYSFAFVLDVLILAPFLEEFFFRGYMIGIILEAATLEKEPVVSGSAVITAIIVSICAFVVMHPATESLTALYYGFLFSALMVAYRMIRDSVVSDYALVFPIIPHFSNNFVLYRFGSFISGAVTVIIVLGLMTFWSFLAYRRFKRRLVL
ncbi:MAG: CPBP family glutamic-type intramembrane protease [Candidatus Methanomethyliaceae archaeon]|nr:CPBP family glutamic-type intramembrane protease [Candidatus Methanomethyliaceae archaeon]